MSQAGAGATNNIDAYTGIKNAITARNPAAQVDFLPGVTGGTTAASLTTVDAASVTCSVQVPLVGPQPTAIRLIEPETESALPWAREQYACVIFNLHVDHEASAIAAASSVFVRLIDHAIAHQGSYFLTYHRYARPDQVIACHPRLREWLAKKDQIDPDRLFQSDWYRHLLRVTGEGAV